MQLNAVFIHDTVGGSIVTDRPGVDGASAKFDYASKNTVQTIKALLLNKKMQSVQPSLLAQEVWSFYHQIHTLEF